MTAIGDMAPAPETPRTIDDVLPQLRGWLDHFRGRTSNNALFCALYFETSKAIQQGIRDGRFEDAERMSRFDAVFAERYFVALRSLDGGRPPLAWRQAFTMAADHDAIALQHLLMGMNAHINLDLGIAVARSGVGLDAFHRDFLEINAVLAELLDRVQAALVEFSPALRLVDEFLGEADEHIGVFVMDRAREHAWRVARIASELGDEANGVFEDIVDSSAAQLGRRIARPGPLAAGAIRLVRSREAWTVEDLVDRFASL